MSLISVIIIPAMEYHFVKDLGNRDAFLGSGKPHFQMGPRTKPFKAEKTFICIRIQNFFISKTLHFPLRKARG